MHPHQFKLKRQEVNMTPSILPEHVQFMLNQLANENEFKKPRIETVGQSEQGDNYVGQVFRVDLHDDGMNGKEKLSLIIKCSPRNSKRRELLRTKHLFDNEIFMYESVLPALLRVLKTKGIVSKTQLTFPATAKIYKSRTSEDGYEDTIILKNMSPDGFAMGDRFAGLDADHTRLVLRELARLHASSLVLKDDEPETFRRLAASVKETFCVPEWEPSFKGFIDRARPVIDARFPEGTSGRAKFENFASNFYQIMNELVKPDPRLSVFCHGDTWINNVLFKCEKGSCVPEAVCLIDFQIGRYANPVTDLAYLFFCSTTKAVRDLHFKQLLMDYHRFLCSFLKSFGCTNDKVVSWDVMQDIYHKYMKYGLGMALVTIPIFLSKKGDVAGVNEVGEATKLDEMFIDQSGSSNPERDERMSDVLQDMIEYGYI